jgi:flavodoxin
MNVCVAYFSRTGNTKRLAQAIADLSKACIYPMSSIDQSVLEKCDLLILGTPVEGASPAKETTAFIANMPKTDGKKAILFCTYRIFGNERTMKKMEKAIAEKGYRTILKVSKKGMKPNKEADFSKILDAITQVLDNKPTV